jgi:hypothetical protein
MQITRIGIEPRHLRRGGRDHARMTMPDVANIVHQIEIGVAIFVEQPATEP